MGDNMDETIRGLLNHYFHCGHAPTIHQARVEECESKLVKILQREGRKNVNRHRFTTAMRMPYGKRLSFQKLGDPPEYGSRTHWGSASNEDSTNDVSSNPSDSTSDKRKGGESTGGVISTREIDPGSPASPISRGSTAAASVGAPAGGRAAAAMGPRSPLSSRDDMHTTDGEVSSSNGKSGDAKSQYANSTAKATPDAPATPPFAPPVPHKDILSLRLLLQRQAKHLPGALEDLRKNKRKTKHWAWWAFPTQKGGTNEPNDNGMRTYVTRKTAPLLVDNAPKVWKQVLETLAELIVNNNNTLEPIVLPGDCGRIEHFIRFWKNVRQTPRWLHNVLNVFKNSKTKKNQGKNRRRFRKKNARRYKKYQLKRDRDKALYDSILRFVTPDNKERASQFKEWAVKNNTEMPGELRRIADRDHKTKRIPGEKGTGFEGTVSFIPGDMITYATEAASKLGPNKVAVLNMANATTPGGGFINGARAQEEQLCHRSTLYLWLRVAQASGLYPIKPGTSLITPNAYIGLDEKFRPLKSPAVGVVSAAATQYPNEESARQNINELERELVASWHAVIAGARELKATVLVVSALGAGAFKNPPDVVGSTLINALTNCKPGDTLKDIAVVVLDDHNARSNVKRMLSGIKKALPGKTKRKFQFISRMSDAP